MILAHLNTLLNALKSLSFPKMMRVIGLLLRHPLFSALSFYATMRTIHQTQKYFPNTHNKSGKGNAFRHALWCCTILMYCCKISSPRKALSWCKKMTDTHEELFPNLPLEKQMDLHNNKVGMNIFTEMLNGIHRQFFEMNFFIPILFDKLKTAEILSDENSNSQNELVYIKD